ncbi:MAG: pteridine reductase [Gammaproteobacteria bacterium]|nr:pteridine reductase [Gammaproteobacteria bacterium]
MPDYTPLPTGKVVLITGAAQRIGAGVVRSLHKEGMKIALHYHRSGEAAAALGDELNQIRPGSVSLFQTNILITERLPRLVEKVIHTFGRLDVLISNASSFYPTPISSLSEPQWDELMGTNLKAPLFLAAAAAPHLKACRGSIINIADIHGIRPLKNHTIYSAAKAGLIMLTHSLARELGPEVRVNAIAPGAILWPEQELDEVTKQRVITRTPLKRQGTPEEIAKAIRFLILDADYMTGQVIPVDGGRLWV